MASQIEDGRGVVSPEQCVSGFEFRVLKKGGQKYEIPKRDKSILPLMQVAPGA